MKYRYMYIQKPFSITLLINCVIARKNNFSEFKYHKPFFLATGIIMVVKLLAFQSQLLSIGKIQPPPCNYPVQGFFLGWYDGMMKCFINYYK